MPQTIKLKYCGQDNTTLFYKEKKIIQLCSHTHNLSQARSRATQIDDNKYSIKLNNFKEDQITLFSVITLWCSYKAQRKLDRKV